jgi:hypothetical protein
MVGFKNQRLNQNETINFILIFILNSPHGRQPCRIMRRAELFI